MTDDKYVRKSIVPKLIYTFIAPCSFQFLSGQSIQQSLTAAIQREPLSTGTLRLNTLSGHVYVTAFNVVKIV